MQLRLPASRGRWAAAAACAAKLQYDVEVQPNYCVVSSSSSKRRLFAILQVDAWARSRSLQVVGLYHANERLTDRELGAGPRKVGDKLQQQCNPQAAILLVGWHAVLKMPSSDHMLGCSCCAMGACRK